MPEPMTDQPSPDSESGAPKLYAIDVERWGLQTIYVLAHDPDEAREDAAVMAEASTDDDWAWRDDDLTVFEAHMSGPVTAWSGGPNGDWVEVPGEESSRV